MKLTFISLLVLFTARVLGQSVYSDYQDGIIIFQLKETESLKNYNLENPLGSMNEIADLSQEYGIQSIKFLYPRHKDSKLSRTIQLEFQEANRVLEFAKSIEQLDYTEYAERKELHHNCLTPNDQYFVNSFNSGQWGLFQINAEQAWNISTGDANVIVAVTDNAINTNHPDLINKCVAGWDAVDNDNDPNPCGGNDGFHGSHVSGIVGAESNNGIGVASIGYDVSIMPIKIGNCTSGALTGGYEGVTWAADNGAHVINMSWGGSGYSNYGQNVCNYAWGQGSILIAAAGNDNVTSIFYPAGYNNVVSVASSSSGDSKSSFSNYGSWIDITAPGSSILSTNQGTSYQVTQGTSMASPMVAGLAGLIKSHAISASNTDIINCLLNTAVNIDGANPSYVGQLGAGRIDAYQAMLCASTFALALDASISNISVPEGNICGSTFTPSFDLRNLGSNTLTSTTITYQISGQAAQTLNWTGSLTSGQTETVTLPTQTLPDGSYTFTVSTNNPNGSTDQNLSNDTDVNNFNILSTGEQIAVNIQTDCFGEEISWTIEDNLGNTVASGGPYSNVTGGQLETSSICLSQGCYTFTINDSYGDGMYGSQWNSCSVDGDYSIVGSSGNVLVQMSAANADFGNSTTHTFCIASPVPDDAGIVAVSDPNGLSCNSSLTPTVTLQNFGNQPLTSVIISYDLGGATQTFNWTGNLASNQNVSVTLPSITGTAGNLTFTASTSLPNGNSDPNINNDASTSSVTILGTAIALPFIEDFENGLTNQNWIIDNPDGDFTWEIDAVNGTNAPGSNAAKLNFFDYAQQGQRDGMITPPLNFQGYTSIDLDFEHAYRRYDQTLTDSLIISISTDCGQSYTRLLSLGEDGTGSFATATTTTTTFSPTSADWCTGTVGANCFSVNLDNYIGNASVLIKFESYNAGTTGNNLFIDNINLTGVPNNTCPTIASNGTNIDCNGNSNGSIVINATGGGAPLSYSIDGTNYGASNTFNGLTAGNYMTYVQDNTGCIDSATVSITEPLAITNSNVKVDASCLNNDGSITINSNGGTGAYSYSIDNGVNFGTNNTFNGLPSGNYEIVVQDVNGCSSVTSTVSITSASGPTLSASSNDESCQNANGSITITGANGTAPYSYSIDGGNTFSSNNSFNNLSAGAYNLVISDNSGCTSSITQTISNSGGNFTISTSNDASICEGNATTIFVSGVPTGGTTAWDNGLGSNTSHTVSPIATTTYNVTVTDAGGCSKSEAITITVLPIPSVNVITTSDTICSGETITIIANGAQNYNWNTGETGNSITVTPSSTSTYTVIGSNGSCNGNAVSQDIVVLASPTVVANASSNNIQVGTSISFDVNGSNAVNYSWDFGDGNSSTSPTTSHTYSAPGSYLVTLTADNDNCFGQDTIMITVSDLSNSIAENTEFDIIIYPNPAKEWITLSELPSGTTQISIIDLSGKIVKTIATQNNLEQIRLTDIASGSYIIQGFNLESNLHFRSKIIIQK